MIHAPRWLVLTIDLLIVLFAFIASYVLRYFPEDNVSALNLPPKIPLVLLTALLSFLITRQFKNLVRYASLKDIYIIFNSICLHSVILIISSLGLTYLGGWNGIFKIPLSIIIINSLISFLGLVGSRVVLRSLFDYTKYNDYRKRVMVYGAGESGIITANVISSNTKNNFKLIGFIDDDRQKKGKRINGLDVFDKTVIDEGFVEKTSLDIIIISIQNISSSKLRSLVDQLTQLNLQVMTIPPPSKWVNGELRISQIKEIQIEDLLNRPPINIFNEFVAQEIENKTLVVTGGAGSIGSEIVRQLSNYNYSKIVVLDIAESPLYDLQQEMIRKGKTNMDFVVADVRDEQRLRTLMGFYKPEMIFHAAAYKHVPLMEYNAYEAIKINVAGTRNIVNLSAEFGVKRFVFVSTDKAVNPTNVMGASKRIAELYISCMNKKQTGTKFMITRFGNVLGSNGSVIPLFKKQIESGGPLTVTHREVTRFFMTIPEASQLVLEAGCMGKGGEIFIFDMGESVKIFDLAKNMISLSGLRYPEDIDIEIVGLRPGEKLYEELLAQGENNLPTYNDKIMINKQKEIDCAHKLSQISTLCELNHEMSKKVVSLMKEIVPEFKSENSDLVRFDKN